jgi:hypothetical protein
MLSELQQMRQNIELECLSLKNLQGFATVANHAAIQRSLKRIETEENKLATLVGKEQATNEMCTIYHKVIG